MNKLKARHLDVGGGLESSSTTMHAALRRYRMLPTSIPRAPELPAGLSCRSRRNVYEHYHPRDVVASVPSVSCAWLRLLLLMLLLLLLLLVLLLLVVMVVMVVALVVKLAELGLSFVLL